MRSINTSDTNPSITLTRKEIECVNYIHKGLTTKEIAQHLKISPRTVETHFRNIRFKLDAKNLIQMIIVLIKQYPHYFQ